MHFTTILANYGIAFFFLQLKVKSLILAASWWSNVWMLVTGIYRELCLESVKNKYECEIQAACQHWEVRGQHMSQSSAFLYVKPHFVHIYFCLYSVGETQCHSVHYLNRMNWPTVTSPGDGFHVFFSQLVCLVSVWQSEKLLLFDTVQSELEEKIRRLEEDRHSIDITSGTDQGCNQQLSEMSFFDYLSNKNHQRLSLQWHPDVWPASPKRLVFSLYCWERGKSILHIFNIRYKGCNKRSF